MGVRRAGDKRMSTRRTTLSQIAIFGALTLVSSLLLIRFLLTLDSDATVLSTSEKPDA